MRIYESLVLKEKKISVTGLGYVGLPLALELAKKYSVIGFDISEDRIARLKKGIDPSKELDESEFQNRDIVFTADVAEMRKAHFHIIAVPTPVDHHKVPNLGPVTQASITIGKILKKGDYVVYESTVYPGCTEEDCLPILEKESGLSLGEDFKLGYSPERINPGDKEHTLTKVLKVVSGSDKESLREISRVYGSIIEAGIHEAKSIKVAEAAKVIENTQRDLNIALMNELSIIFDQMDLDTKAVLEAAGTKWNFLKFSPGLVGGHCIGVDPYYLTYKAQKLGYSPRVILSGRSINDGMPEFIAKKLVQTLTKIGKSPNTSTVLIKGVTFKENVADIRNSRVADLIKELQEYSINVHISDPYASAIEVGQEYNLTMTDHISYDYDAIIIAVAHDEYVQEKKEDYMKLLTDDNPILFDLKGIHPSFSNNGINYWSL